MSTQIEIRPKEIAPTLEGWKRWFFAMLLITVLALASGKEVEAQDGDDIYMDNSPITVIIPDGAIVREDRGMAASMIINDFPRGPAQVVGWADPTDANQSFRPYGDGTWLIVKSADGQVGITFPAGEGDSPDVLQNDGTPVTQDELAAASIPEFSAGQQTFGVQPIRPAATEEPTATTVSGGNGGNAETAATATPTAEETPESDGNFTLETSEIPDTITANVSAFNPATNTIETIEISVPFNRESAMSAFPLGVVDLDAYPALEAFADRIAPNGRGDGRAIVVSAIWVANSTDGSGGFIPHFSIPTEDGRFVTFSGTGGNYMGIFHLDENNQIANQNEIDNLTIESRAPRIRENSLLIGQTPTIPGTQVLIILHDGNESDDGDVAQRRVNGGRNTVETIAEMQENPEYQALNPNNRARFQPFFHLAGFIIYE